MKKSLILFSLYVKVSFLVKATNLVGKMLLNKEFKLDENKVHGFIYLLKELTKQNTGIKT